MSDPPNSPIEIAKTTVAAYIIVLLKKGMIMYLKRSIFEAPSICAASRKFSSAPIT